MFRLLIFLTLIVTTNKAFALSLIRDSQTENYLYKISSPILEAAGLSNQVKFHIVNDSGINAFVANGKNIFVNSGTITLFEDPLGLIGVIAHETGHITGGHLARMSEDIESIKKQMALGFILGLATAFGGNAEAGQAIILGSSHIGQRQFFSYSTRHEEAADEAALRYLDQANIDATGLLDFFKEIRDMESIYFDKINPYTRTHPLTKNRLKRISDFIDKNKLRKFWYNKEIYSEHKIIRAKLLGFLDDSNKIIETYKEAKDEYAIAYAAALHRIGESKKAIKILRKSDYSNNPYIKELIGQFYYESGQAKLAVETYKETLDELPNEALIQIQYAASINSLNDENLFNTAIQALEKAIIKEKENIFAWSLLAELSKKTKDDSLFYLSLAEKELILGNFKKSKELAEKAKKLAEAQNNGKRLIRINDIIVFSEEKLK